MILGNQIIYDDGWKVNDLRALRRDKIGIRVSGALSDVE
jgi:putative ABC transport system ATP-binding protein